MKLTKGATVRWAGQRELFTVVQRGLPERPRSRKWLLIEDEQGFTHSAAITDLYEDGPAWHRWQEVYDRTSAEAKAELTCPCCGQTDYNRMTYGTDASARRSVELSIAHDAAVNEAGRQTFRDRYGHTHMGIANEALYEQMLAEQS